MSEEASRAPVDDREDEESSAEEQDEDEPPVESLVTGRKKRVTAGNRLSSLLEHEGDDELQLLFAENEEEEDVEFEGEDDEGSDAELGSSSDEEDQGPTKGNNDDLAGEIELQKQDRLERQKKRKAHDVFKKPGALRKKVKIDPSAVPVTPGPRPKKKSERVSWLHTEADAPTRASSRKQTVQNREVVHQRLVDSEQSRLKLMQQMEEAQKRKDAMKPKALTQADRLEEAAKTERKNAKSLNRWEESERKRSEEQKAKLEALHNRQLTGPVIAWWSGLARWVNGKIEQLGVKSIRAQGFVENPSSNESASTEQSNEKPHQIVLNGEESHDSAMPDVLHPHHLTESTGQLAVPESRQSAPQQHYTFAPPQGPYGFLDGIHAYAALPVQHQQAEFTGTAEGGALSQGHVGATPSKQGAYAPPMFTPVPIKSAAPTVECASRSLVALKNIDASAIKLPELKDNVLVRDKKKGIKLQKSAPEICAITMQPARFRDPKTGLPYANSYAYKEIQRLREGGSRWSNLLDCYVGPVNSPAQGVPERFWRRP